MPEKSLIKKLEEAESLNDKLKQENELLHHEIARLRRILGVEKVFNDFASLGLSTV